MGSVKHSIQPSRVSGTVKIPGSKSHTIRGLLIAAFAEGRSRLNSPLESSDTASCREAVTALGAKVHDYGDHWEVEGTGGRISEPAGPIDVGNSGTTLYLATGMAATANVPVRFTGDDQIGRRSAQNLLMSLRDLCAHVRCDTREGYVPYTVHGPLRGGTTGIESRTSQHLSSLLLAAPLAAPDREETVIRVPLLYEQPYVDMTLGWLDAQGISCRRSGYEEFSIPTGQHYRPFTADIPADFSTATFFAAAAAITGASLRLEGLDMEDSQGDKEAFDIFARMGCSVQPYEGGVEIRGPADGGLGGGEFDLNRIPDTLPALSVTAAFSSQRVVLGNVPQARQKETDRIAVMREELVKLGVSVEELEDGLVIRGSRESGSRSGETPAAGGASPGPRGAEVSGHGDHRVIMALAVAGLAADGPVSIDETEPAAVTFPEFFHMLEAIGARVISE